MTTTHDDNATTWRDLADQLTPEQIAELEYCERENIPPGVADARQGQLNCARAMAQHNIVQALCADIATPADAVSEVYEWEERGGDTFGRMYGISLRDLGFTTVDVSGVQYNDGHVERHILVYEAEDLTADQARALAAALLNAADDIERLG
jgi:hypothetical protein